jgi:5-oxoprolinase (ATP-hydrolysing) subunit A
MPADAGPAPRDTVDLNADLGEEITDDAGLLAVVTSANVACGFHAGTPVIMRTVCAEAARRGVVVGAQVSYRDRAGFGRVARDVAFDELRDQVAEQVELLSEIARGEGTEVRYLKPHGALYHRVTDDPEQAEAVLAGSGDLPVLGFPGSLLLARAAAAGRTSYEEGFPDRGYAHGRLVDRGSPGALLQDGEQIARQGVALAPRVASLCVHGDSPDAVGHAHAVRRALTDAGFRLRSFLVEA